MCPWCALSYSPPSLAHASIAYWKRQQAGCVKRGGAYVVGGLSPQGRHLLEPSFYNVPQHKVAAALLLFTLF